MLKWNSVFQSPKIVIIYFLYLCTDKLYVPLVLFSHHRIYLFFSGCLKDTLLSVFSFSDPIACFMYHSLMCFPTPPSVLSSHSYFQEWNYTVLQIKGTSVLSTSFNRYFLFKHYFIQFFTAFICEMTNFLRHKDGQITETCLLLLHWFIIWHFSCISLGLTPPSENNWYLLYFFFDELD